MKVQICAESLFQQQPSLLPFHTEGLYPLLKNILQFWSYMISTSQLFICLKILEDHVSLHAVALHLVHQGQLAQLALPPEHTPWMHHHNAHPSWHLKTTSHDISNSSVQFLHCLETKFISLDCWHCFLQLSKQQPWPKKNLISCSCTALQAMGLHLALQSKAAPVVLTLLWWDITGETPPLQQL